MAVTFDQYAALARRTQNKDASDQLVNAALGLNGEAGELADVIKKARFQGHPLNEAKLVNEAGDILWYLALLADTLGIPLETIATRNIQKLDDRYGGQFSEGKSVNRKDKKDE